MTSIIPENRVEAPLSQEKVDTNLSPTKLDANVTPQQTENKPVDNTAEDPNWRALREARKQDKIKREEAERRASEKDAEIKALTAAMEAVFSKNQMPNQNQSGYQEEETEDQRIEKKVQIAIAQREAQSEKARIERERSELPHRLTQTFPDYMQVVNEENGAYLEYHHPELYRSILRQPENFETCSDIYKLVKKYVPNSTTAKKDAVKADNNFNKPKSISSNGLTQTGEVMSSSRLTEEKRAANWERMQKQLKGIS